MTGGLLKLRDYQVATIEAIHTRWDAGERRTAAVLPTGAGKTFVFSHLVTRWLESNPGKRVLILAHTEELVTQAYKDLRGVAPKLNIGIVKAGRNQVTADVIIGCVPTLRSLKRRAQIRRVGLIIVDEVHHVVAPTYRAILKHFGALDPDLGEEHLYARYADESTLMAGFTATLARGDNQKLSEVIQSVAYRKDIGFMIRRGYLRDVTGKRVEVADLELSKVKKSGGDYQAADLGEALEASLAPEIVAKAVVEHAGDRSGVLFAPTVSAAYAFADALNNEGVKTEVVHGQLPDAERRAILDRLESGVTRFVSNCMVLTEGFNCPRVSCVVVARPTRSAPLYQQMVGRGLRLWCPTHGRHGARIRPEPCCAESVTVGLILDVVGASRVHGLASLIDLSEKDLKEISDEMTLIEAEDLEETEQGSDSIKLIHTGPVESVDFDPLDRDSRSAWNRTAGGGAAGIWFLSVGGSDGRYVFLLPSSLPDAELGTWDVIWSSKSPFGKREHGATEHRGIGMEAAFAWAEDVAEEWGSNGWGDDGASLLNTTRKTAAWRRKPASAAQLKELKRRRIELPQVVLEWEIEIERWEGYGEAWRPMPPCPLSAGDASILIDAHAAGIRIDPIAKWVESHRTSTAS